MRILTAVLFCLMCVGVEAQTKEPKWGVGYPLEHQSRVDNVWTRWRLQTLKTWSKRDQYKFSVRFVVGLDMDEEELKIHVKNLGHKKWSRRAVHTTVLCKRGKAWTQKMWEYADKSDPEVMARVQYIQTYAQSTMFREVERFCIRTLVVHRIFAGQHNKVKAAYIDGLFEYYKKHSYSAQHNKALDDLLKGK